jgi:Protein of unknown function (DUF1524)
LGWLKRNVGWKLSILIAILLVASCGAILGGGSEDPSGSYSSASDAPSSADPTAGPMQNVPADSVLAAAYDLQVAEPEPDGYDRDEFGQKWADVDRNGCDQRNDVLRRDLVKLHTKPETNGCVLARGVLESSPYSGDKIKWAKGDTTIEIDHVVSLADAWRMGASDWAPRSARSSRTTR